jgi:peptide/nickel transport system permease protein
MQAYLFRRLAAAVPTILITGLAVFMLVHLTPGDPAGVMLGSDATAEQLARLRQTMGLDRPVLAQLASWSLRVLRGDMGQSYFMRTSVTGALGQAFGPTLLITLLALTLAVTIGVTAGVLSAVRRGSALDDAVMVLAILGVSMPEFWLALNLILLFAAKLKWLPVAGYVSPAEGVGKALRYAALPALALGLTQAAFLTRMVRSAVLEVLSEDYVRTARAKGLRERVVVLRHMLRNAMIPIVTVIGLSVAILIGGAITIETVFNIPGIGRLLIGAALRRDYPLIQGITLFIATTYILINLAIDVLYAVIDPRIRYT